MDPQNEALLSLTILLTGLVVVFAVLIFLILIINVYGNIIYKVTQKMFVRLFLHRNLLPLR